MATAPFAFLLGSKVGRQPGAVLRIWEEPDAAELTEVIAANREHLARWLPWAESHGFEDSVDYLARKRAQVEANDAIEAARGSWRGVDAADLLVSDTATPAGN